MEPRVGLEGMLEYGGHKHSIWGSMKNVFTAFVITCLWVIIVTVFFHQVLGMQIGEIRNIITARLAIYSQMPAAVSGNPYAIFFFSVVFAPLWEEAAFRYAPLGIARFWEEGSGQLFDRGVGYLTRSRCLYPMLVLSSIVFGLAHGSVINILIQGVTGLMLGWVMLKSGYPYAVLTHALWNWMLLIGMPILTGGI